MKLVHIPFSYYPDPVGGTEVYVRALAREQQLLGDSAFVVAPGKQSYAYEHDGVPVHRFAVADDVSIDEVYLRDRSVDQKAFDAILDRTQPDVVHVHGYTPTINRNIISSIRGRGSKLIFTYHTPTATCVRGTLRLFGTAVCDGMLIASRCATCSLQARGMPLVAASALSVMPSVLATLVPAGKARTALRMRKLIEQRHAEIRNFLAATDRVVAPANWAMAVLRRVGVPDAKLLLNRQGVFAAATQRLPHERGAGVLRLAFLGRLDPTKGLHVVLDALSRIPNAEVSLTIFPAGPSGGAYVERLRTLIGSDRRVELHDPIEQADVIHKLTGFDALVVPSQWLETGPLVVLEAFEAGIPVIGSDLGGIAELVTDGIDGVLVPPEDAEQWARVIGALATEDARYEQLTKNVRPARTMRDVALDMAKVYNP